VLLLGRFVSALKLWLDAAIVLAVELALVLGDVTGVLDNEVVVAELDEEPLVALVPALEEPLADTAPALDEEPLGDVAPALDEEPLGDVAPALSEEPLVEVVGPAPDGDPDPDVVTAAGVRVAACAVPIPLVLLPLHAASINNAAPLISAAT
jgi:hypothetical protein